MEYLKKGEKEIQELFGDIHHFGLYVKNIDEVIKLYCKIFGMKIERDTGYESLDNEYLEFISTVTGIKCSNARIVYLRRSEIRIELVQFTGSEKSNSINIPIYAGNYHIAFTVSDLAKTYDFLISQGYIPISRPIVISKGINEGVKVVYFTDKEGFRFELMQMN